MGEMEKTYQSMASELLDKFLQAHHGGQSKGKQVAQGQYVVSDTRCLTLSDCE